jgi:flagellar protein FlbB
MELQENESKVTSKFQWFLFVVLIPLLFAITVALVILTISGVNVFDITKKYGQHIPFVEKFTNGTDAVVNIEEKLRVDLNNLEAKNKEQITAMTKLEKELDQRQLEIDGMKLQIERLTEELDQKEQEQQNKQKSIKEVAKIYESMSTKNAAAILTELDDDAALTILFALNNNIISSILEKMEPADAARYTELLTKNQTNTP